MTITTADPRAIRKAAGDAGLAISTLRPIAGDDWMVGFDDAGATKPAILTFCKLLIAADPTAVILVGKIRIDAAALADK